MNRLVAMAFLLGLAAPAMAESSGFEVNFDPPGQIGPSIHTVNGTWALVIFSDSSSSEMSLYVPGGSTYTNRTIASYNLTTPSSETKKHLPPSEETSTFDSPLEAALSSLGKVGSLYLEGQRIAVASNGSGGQIVAKGRQDCVSALMSVNENSFSDAVRSGALCPQGPNAVVTVRASKQDPFVFTVTADALRLAEWHGLNVACGESHECPSGGVRRQDQTSLPGNVTLTNNEFGFSTLEAASPGTFSGTGTAVMVLIGGFELDAAIDGAVRLASAETSSCESCIDPEGRTLGAEGHIEMTRLRPGEDGRLTASLGGDVASVRLDEVRLDPNLVGFGVTTAAAAATVGLVLLFKLLAWPLFTRHTEKGPLANERRRRLHDFVMKNPGAHFREVLRGVGIPSGSGRFHIISLVRAGLLVERRVGSKVRLFEGGLSLHEGWQDMAALRNPNLRLLHDWIQDHPDRSQKDILGAFKETRGWNASTTQGRLARLVKDGIVRTRVKGRYKHYAVAKAAALQATQMPFASSVSA